MFSGVLLFVVSVPLAIIMGVVAIVTTTASIAADAVQKDKDRKAARELERQRKR